MRPKMVLRNRYILFLDMLLILFGVVLSFSIRFDEWRLWDLTYGPQMFLLAVLALVVKPLVYFSIGLYSQIWRHGGLKEARSIAVAVSASSAVLTVVVLGIFLPQGLGPQLGLSHLTEFPRSVLIIDWLLSFSLVAAPRAAARRFPQAQVSPRAAALHKKQGPANRVLVVGAGEAGAKVVREITSNPGLGLVPVAFVDDDPGKQNLFVHGLQVLGTRIDIPTISKRLNVQEVVVALPTAPGREIRSIVEICEGASLPCRVLPGFFELVNGQASLEQAREPSIEDVLRRQAMDLGVQENLAYLDGAIVLVTGAGGSIGSELCRQVAVRGVRQLILLGHGENSIYRINLELSKKFPSLDITPVIADIRSRSSMSRLFMRYRPDVVFHAAAHKHVPFTEANVQEAVANNVFGTDNVLEASLMAGVSRFVFVSTDKAVNPVSILGVTKRLGEMLVQRAAARNGGKYLSVRFGNVLGSRGSVVPLFLEQIASGGPVTVTHPEVTRFFMTASEAVHLILHAAALGKGGETFVLDMGEPVAIADLAADLVRLRGLEPGKDIDILYTGLRPGEKLHEEIFSEKEIRVQSSNPCILIAAGNGLNGLDLPRELEQLRLLLKAGTEGAIKSRLKRLVPEYRAETECCWPVETQREPAHTGRSGHKECD